MHRLLILTASLFLLSACDEESYKGLTNTLSPLSIKTDKGTLVIPAGVAATKMKITSSGKLEIEVEKEGQKSLKAKISLPRSAKPNDRGQIKISSKNLKQKFDIEGQRSVSTQKTEPYTQEESCISGYRDGGEVCDWESTGPSCYYEERCGTNALGEPICKSDQVCEDGGSNYVCHTEQIPEYGTQTVRRMDTITTTAINLNFLVPKSSTVISNFTGEYKNRKSKVLSSGACF
jgi:bifunctional DNA-binding transcriptional regulator/antitoxin component of YhaV-PrlF toxin-antitoxin module